MKKPEFIFLVFISIMLSSCGNEADFDQIAILEQRINQLESGLKDTNDNVSDTVELLESGKCSIVDSNENSALLQCNDGTSYIIKNGEKGDKGEKGDQGHNCSVKRVIGSLEDKSGVLVTCGSETSKTTALILDGVDSVSGIIGFENPCGVNGKYDEILLRMSDGSLIAHYASGNKQFLTLLTPGHYKTTDGYSCNFEVTSNLEINS